MPSPLHVFALGQICGRHSSPFAPGLDAGRNWMIQIPVKWRKRRARQWTCLPKDHRLAHATGALLHFPLRPRDGLVVVGHTGNLAAFADSSLAETGMRFLCA